MTKRVLKYEVLVGHPLDVMIPSPPPEEGLYPYDCVHVDVLQERPVPNQVWIWLEVDDSQPSRRRKFEVFPTGAPLPDDSEHCGSVRHISSGLVWHVYEEAVS